VIERTFEVWKKRLSLFNYKAQVQIVVASIAILNYIKRTSLHDVVFIEFDRYPDFVPKDFLTDVAPYSYVEKKLQAFVYGLRT
jgi:hypothetical protein